MELSPNTTTSDAGRKIAQQAKQSAREYAHQAKARGQEMLQTQKHRAADQLHTVGNAVHRAADKFREERDDNIAGYVDAMADEVDRFADYLDQRDATRLIRDAQDFGRREPEWFLGGMFLAGLALTRFLKASGERNRMDASRPHDSAWSASGASEPRPWSPQRGATNPADEPINPSIQPPSEVQHYGPCKTQ